MSVGKLFGTRTKSSEFVFSGLLESLCVLFSAMVILESSVATEFNHNYQMNKMNITIDNLLGGNKKKKNNMYDKTFYLEFSFGLGSVFLAV